jgi:hypothetical protein
MARKLRMFVVAGVVVGALAAGSFAIAGALDKPLEPPKVPGSKHFSASLTGYQEVSFAANGTSISTGGFGDFTADLVSDTQLHYTLRFSDLEGGNTLFAHVHLGQRGTAGGVSFFLCGGGGKPACPNSPGEISGDVGPADVIGPAGQGIGAGEFDEIVKAMRAGYAYANVHTTVYPSGEIRGQINSDTGEKGDK